MKIDLHSLEQERLFRVTLAPGEQPAKASPDPRAPQFALDWTDVMDARGTVVKCPVCGCAEMFARRDFPQRLGLAIIVASALASFVFFYLGWILTCFAVLAAAVVLDRVISFFTGQCIVCYRCRSEFRDVPIPGDYPTWDLSTGEKYRVDVTQSGKENEKK